jgi:hypothetical protein
MSLETELQKMYDSEIHVDIGWLWDGGIDLSIGNDEVTGNVRTVAEVLSWLQKRLRSVTRLPNITLNASGHNILTDTVAS